VSTQPNIHDAAENHVEEIAIAASTAVKTLLHAGHTRQIEQESLYATVVAYFVGEIVRVDIKPRHRERP
jgi:hypothetical protein